MELIMLAAVAAAVAFWIAGMGARESAVRTARRACGRHGVQFLDETVALSRLGLARDAGGRLRFARTFRFEFSLGGDRHSGAVHTIGAQVTDLRLDMPDYRLYDTEDEERP